VHVVIRFSKFAAQPIRRVVLPLAVRERNDRNVVRLGERPHALTEVGRDPAEDDRRGNRLSEVLANEGDQSTGRGQQRNVSVEVQPVHALNFQCHMAA